MDTPANNWPQDWTKYGTLRCLRPSGQIVSQVYPQAQQLCQQLLAGTTEELSDRACQEKLWYLWQAGAENAAIAQLCLRCWLSHKLEIVCKKIVQDFGATYGFGVADLWSRVLDDTGDLSPTHESLAINILKTYRPERGALSAWASRLAKSNRLHQFLLSHGLYLATPWAILNDTQGEQLRRFLPHMGDSEIAIATRLLHAYHRVYRCDRIRNRAKRGHRCLSPTTDQLHRIDPSHAPHEVMEQLHELANQLRSARIARRGGPLPSGQLPKQSQARQNIEAIADHSDHTHDDDTREADFMATYQQDFRATLGDAIQATVAAHTERLQAKKVTKGQLYRQALELFYCQGIAMKDIANTLGLANQVAVTRLLNLRQLRAEVGICWVTKLKQRVNASALEHMSIAQLERISAQLDQILTEETQQAMAIAASEAQIPKDRTAKSLFAQQICTTVPAMPPPA